MGLVDGEATVADNGDYSLGEVVRSVRRIEDKLDSQLRDHEQRLRALESWMWRSVGLGAAGIASGVGAWVQVLLKGHS